MSRSGGAHLWSLAVRIEDKADKDKVPVPYGVKRTNENGKTIFFMLKGK